LYRIEEQADTIEREGAMARTPLDQLSAQELSIAMQNFREIERTVEKNATEFPGPGWETVRELIVEAGEKLHLEEKRRYEQRG
jgi:hypothetical protein